VDGGAVAVQGGTRSDIVEGQAGFDRMDSDGSNATETMGSRRASASATSATSPWA
jgi:hypothetical protein